jgi:hypothetical protein
MRSLSFLLVACFASLHSASAIDYVKDVLPIMKEHCWKCHSNEHEVKGSLALDDLTDVRDFQIGEFNIIRPGNSNESSFLEKMTLDPGEEDFMPRKGEPVPKKEIDIIRDWIDAGAIVDAEKPSEKETAFLNGGGGMDLAAAKETFLVWTNREGKSFEARLEAIKPDAVSLLRKDGQRFDVKRDILSDADQERLKKWDGE